MQGFRLLFNFNQALSSYKTAMTKQSLWVSLLGTLIATSSYGQYAGDVFRYSEINQTGTARFQSIGGNHAALGGDASTITGNPAGLGFYTRSEISISPSFSNVSTQSKYIGQTTSESKGNVNFTNGSLVITSQPGFQRKWKRTSLGFSFSRQQSFQNAFTYRGSNNKSAFVDKVIEDANNTGWTDSDYDKEYTDNQGTIRYLDHAYYELQMIYPTRFVSSTEGYGPPYARDDRDKVTDQLGSFSSKGGQSQVSISYGGNYNDKLFVGGSVGFNRVKYSYLNSLTDSFVNATVFRSSTKSEDFNVNGSGINATFGIIYKVSQIIQLGGTITSPTFMAIKETFNENIHADYIAGSIRNENGQDVGPTISNISLVPNEFEYRLTSPFRGSAGITTFFQDKGFITGTLEYVGYSGMNVRTSYLDDAGNTAFRNDTKAEIKDTYRNVVNVRIGGEYRVSAFRGRLGFGYMADPYLNNDGLNRQKLLFSAGLGVRKNKFFADLSGTLMSYKSAYTPYFLDNPQDYSSVEISNKPINVVLSVGTFF